MSLRARLLLPVLAVTVIGLPQADAAPVGSIAFSAPRPLTARLVVKPGEHLVTDQNPFDGPEDVRVTTRGSWYAVAIRSAKGDPVFVQFSTPRTDGPVVFLPFDDKGIGAGTYTLTVAGDAPVSVALEVTGGSRRRVLTGRATTASYRDADASSPLPLQADGRLTTTVPAGALVLAGAGSDNTLGQVGSTDVCLAPTGGACSEGGFTFISPGSTGGSGSMTLIRTDLAPGRWDVVSQQREVGLLVDPYVLGLVLGS